MKSILLTAALFATITMATAQSYNVTFQVDMNLVGAAFTTPEVNGTFNGWCGGCNPLADADGDGIWSATIPMTAGSYEYKFAYDSWAGQESLTPGDPCTVTAGGFTNRSLNVAGDVTLNPVCWGICGACGVVGLAQMDLPVTFEDPTVEYGLIGFGGAEASTIEVDPTDPSNMVAKVIKSATAELWAGTTITAPAQAGFATAIPFTDANTQMTVRIWSPDAGIQVRLKVEDHLDPTHSVETEATTTVAGGWEMLTFDFSNEAPGTAALNLGYTFDKASIFFNFGVTGAAAGEKIYYFDNVMFVGGGLGLAQMDLPVTFEDPMVEYGLIGFGGAEVSTIEIDPTDPSNTVAKVIKSATAELWAGTTITAPAQAGFATAIPFTDVNTFMSVRIWSPDAGIQVRLKTEDHLDPTHSVETEATTTVAGDWEILTFDFSNEAPGTAALNLAYTFDKASIFFNFGVTGAAAGEKTYYFDNVIFGTGVATDYMVTFSVNMNDVVAGFTTPEVNGTFNGWCGGCNPLSDADGDGIWSTTLPIPGGTYQYKFAYDAWAGSEDLTAGDPCTITDGGFTNRALEVTADTDLGAVCWGSCSDCTPVGDTYNVTFSVNMNDVVEPFTTPEVNGNFNGWCGGCAPMADPDGDNIWTLTIALAAGTYEYKFAYDTWAGQENLIAGTPCTITTGAFTNRALVVSDDAVLETVCWGFCTDCDAVVPTYNVLFKVNMNDVTDAFTTPEVNGTFNGWCGGCAPMSDVDGDNIWELSIALSEGTYEYKFAYDSWAGSESLTEGDPCTITTDGFTNRALNITSDATLDAVCWGSCSACQLGVNNFANATEVTLSPNPTSSFVTITVNALANEALTLTVSDVFGNIVNSASQINNKNMQLDTEQFASGIYFIQITNGYESITKKLIVQH